MPTSLLPWNMQLLLKEDFTLQHANPLAIENGS